MATFFCITAVGLLWMVGMRSVRSKIEAIETKRESQRIHEVEEKQKKEMLK